METPKHKTYQTMPAELGLFVDKNFYGAALNLIHDAKKEILMSTFKLQLIQGKSGEKVVRLVSELISISSLIKNTKVLLNMDSLKGGTGKINLLAADQLKKSGIEVRYLSDGRTMHSKTLIVDSERMIIGSHNWSIASISRNFELSIHVKKHQIISETRAIFLSVFENAKKF